MKFTEEQYQKIVETFDRQDDYIQVMKEIRGLVISICHYSEINQAILLALPESREWAHDKFVEKEKKYYWTSKKRSINDVNKKSRIYREEFSDVLVTYVRDTDDHKNINEDEQLTESEIKAWGFNPEMFDKEEV